MINRKQPKINNISSINTLKSKADKTIDKPVEKPFKQKSPPGKKTSKQVSQKPVNNKLVSRSKRGRLAWKNSTIKHMKALDVYHESYEDIIDIYADLLYEYQIAQALFIKSGREFEVMTENGTTKKSGLVSAIEVLRKDIGTYSDRLLLNEKSNGGLSKKEVKNDKMASFFEDYS